MASSSKLTLGALPALGATTKRVAGADTSTWIHPPSLPLCSSGLPKPALSLVPFLAALFRLTQEPFFPGVFCAPEGSLYLSLPYIVHPDEEEDQAQVTGRLLSAPSILPGPFQAFKPEKARRYTSLFGTAFKTSPLPSFMPATRLLPQAPALYCSAHSALISPGELVLTFLAYRGPCHSHRLHRLFLPTAKLSCPESRLILRAPSTQD